MSEDLRSRLGRLRRLLQAEEYFAMAATPRFRAVERRMTWHAGRSAMVVIGLLAPVHGAALALLHPADAAAIAVVDAAVGASAFALWWSLGGVLRHRPELAVFMMSLAVAMATMLLGLDGPNMVELSIGYVLFLPPVVTLVVPWRSWTEVRWLAVYGIAAIVFLTTIAPDEPLVVADRPDLIFALLVALSAAMAGHVLLFRRQVRAFAQLQALGRLQRREMRQRAELQRLHRSLKVTARTDELTGVGNRLRLNEDLRSARGRLARTGGRFGLLEIDLDHFKGVNDALGHLAGDEVLRQVAATLMAVARSDDSVHRFGGEEFLVILGDVSGGVLAAGERVRAAVEELALAHPSNGPFARVTVSVGAVLIGPADMTETNDEWFGRADVALYLAKAEGRNRVVVAPSRPAPEARPAGPAHGLPAPRVVPLLVPSVVPVGTPS